MSELQNQAALIVQRRQDVPNLAAAQKNDANRSSKAPSGISVMYAFLIMLEVLDSMEAKVQPALAKTAQMEAELDQSIMVNQNEDLDQIIKEMNIAMNGDAEGKGKLKGNDLNHKLSILSNKFTLTQSEYQAKISPLNSELQGTVGDSENEPQFVTQTAQYAGALLNELQNMVQVELRI